MKRFFLCLLFLLSPLGVQAQGAVKDAQTTVELLTPETSIEPGQPFQVGLRMVMDEGWHTYWRNPGDSGLPTSIEWDLPPGFTVGDLQWPYPQKLSMSGITTYGYGGDILLLTRIVPPEDFFFDQPVTLRAHVEWLACKVLCLPGEADLSLMISVKGSSVPEEESLRFQNAGKNFPRESGQWIFRVVEGEAAFYIGIIPLGEDSIPLRDLYFFPYRSDVIEHSAEQNFEVKGSQYRLTVKKSPVFADDVKRLAGILVAHSGWEKGGEFQAVEIDVPIRKKVLDGPGLQTQDKTPFNIWLAIAFAFIGGLILNLMPCVLPVLALKVLNLIEQAHQNETRAWHHGVAFGFGIVFAFWVLAGLLLVLKGLGAQIGWGFQFQSPGFLMGLAVLFFVLALNLFGVFEIGASFTRLGSTGIGGFKGSFFNGILATIVATPCTAPFMGTAIGFALTQGAFTSLLIFTFLGLGLAFPFLILARFPRLLKCVPRPGGWMVRFKQLLGFFLMGAVIWLSWVYGLRQGIDAVTELWAGLLLIGIGLWLWGVSIPSRVKGFTRWIRMFAIFFLIASAGAVMIFTQKISLLSQASEPGLQSEKGISWEDYSPELVERLRKDDRIVFLNFTAAWCLSCQVNERVAFYSPAVIEMFRELNVAAVKADWTRSDQEIAQALAEFGKSSIPLYVVYFPDRNEPVILPELLTPGIVLEALENSS